MRKQLVVAVVFGVAGFGCASAKTPATSGAAHELAPAAAAPIADASGKKTIVHIKSRSQSVTVSSSPRGLLYSVADINGKVLVADASEREFAELQPALYRNIKSYIAVHADAEPALADGPEGEAWSGMDAPSPRLKANTNGGVSSGTVSDQFRRTSERPFPTAREDAAD